MQCRVQTTTQTTGYCSEVIATNHNCRRCSRAARSCCSLDCVAETVLDTWRERPEAWSLHMYAGGWLHMALLFVVHGLLALAVCMGYRTKMSQLALWVMVISLHARNEMVNNYGGAAR